MYIALVLTLGGLSLIGGFFLYAWARSGWLIDRRSAIKKIDRFVDDLNVLSQQFPELSSQLNLHNMNEAWTAQHAEMIADTKFSSWWKSGRPQTTLDDSKSAALFRFARTQADPIGYSIDRVTDTPSAELVRRIRAVIDPRTGRFTIDPGFVRLTKTEIPDEA